MKNNTAKISGNYEDWMNRKWRPLMGYMYMIVCAFDFILFPILWSIAQALAGGSITSQWSPLTLQGAGLFHVAMGAVLGVAAWSRGKEKLAGVEVQSSYRYSEPYHENQPQYRTFVSRTGKVGPIIEEPEL